jgi:hypothetical protein
MDIPMIQLQRLQPDFQSSSGSYAFIHNGEVIAGKQNVGGELEGIDLSDEQKLDEHFSGPTIFASQVEEDRLLHLAEVREEIIDEFGEEESHIFDKYNGVWGFWGGGRTWLVGSKPSQNAEGFPTRHDEFFYELVKNNGLEHAHITDISKLKGPAGAEIEAEELERNLPILEREVEVLNPSLIVAMGDDAADLVDKVPLFDDITTTQVYHYTYGTAYGNKEEVKASFEEIN